jgi:vacuolar-type H+-ATPase subunit E/Vma4
VIKAMNIEKKLELLEKEIMIQAQDECRAILEKYENKKNDMISKCELSLYDSIYSDIQKEKKHIQKEKNSRILAVSYDNKQKFATKREELINEIFFLVNKKVNSFINSDEYISYLYKKVDMVNSLYENEEIEIFINKSDEKYKISLMDYNKKIVSVQISKDDIKGGIIFKGLKSGKVFDNSMKSIIAYERNNFLKSNNLSFEVAKWQ